MITPELIARINELSRKQRSTGLTDAEKIEQNKLRREYLDNIKAQLKGMLDNIEIVDKQPQPKVTHINEIAISFRRELH